MATKPLRCTIDQLFPLHLDGPLTATQLLQKIESFIRPAMPGLLSSFSSHSKLLTKVPPRPSRDNPNDEAQTQRVIFSSGSLTLSKKKMVSIFTNHKMHSTKLNIWHLRNMPHFLVRSRGASEAFLMCDTAQWFALSPRSWKGHVLSVWKLHVLTVSVWLVPRHSCILTHSQDVHIRPTGNWELPEVWVRACMIVCVGQAINGQIVQCSNPHVHSETAWTESRTRVTLSPGGSWRSRMDGKFPLRKNFNWNFHYMKCHGPLESGPALGFFLREVFLGHCRTWLALGAELVLSLTVQSTLTHRWL